jgi:hypothetical protein
MDQHTWSRATKELIASGLIEKKQEGGLYRKKNIYTILVTSIRTVEKHSIINYEIRATGAPLRSVDMKQVADDAV